MNGEAKFEHFPSKWSISVANEAANEEENKPQGFGSKAAQEAKAAAETLGSTTFGSSADDKKNDGGEEEDDDW
ncbi:hypothetical protein GCK72_018628 [Caenorhabditis remanei]|uniref:Uncharacterized protein n=1 Tax=Caenorhabditis remanei TaxID=31234 RepID=A0A6A5GBG8_CAERE|nr:hypothetical protein GCK72_018628 [Caenorhabditis remanei]KAF1752074.1 hypothetical protein GCK72_018628 [Caenorhabditis remanei]